MWHQGVLIDCQPTYTYQLFNNTSCRLLSSFGTRSLVAYYISIQDVCQVNDTTDKQISVFTFLVVYIIKPVCVSSQRGLNHPLDQCSGTDGSDVSQSQSAAPLTATCRTRPSGQVAHVRHQTASHGPVHHGCLQQYCFHRLHSDGYDRPITYITTV